MSFRELEERGEDADYIKSIIAIELDKMTNYNRKRSVWI